MNVIEDGNGADVADDVITATAVMQAEKMAKDFLEHCERYKLTGRVFYGNVAVNVAVREIEAFKRGVMVARDLMMERISGIRVESGTTDERAEARGNGAAHGEDGQVRSGLAADPERH